MGQCPWMVMKGFKEKNKGAQPCFCETRLASYAFCEKMERKLEDLVAEGTLEPTQFSGGPWQ